jgi:hypothetical protein
MIYLRRMSNKEMRKLKHLIMEQNTTSDLEKSFKAKRRAITKEPNKTTRIAMEQAREGKAIRAKKFDEIRDRVRKAQRFRRARCCGGV